MGISAADKGFSSGGKLVFGFFFRIIQVFQCMIGGSYCFIIFVPYVLWSILLVIGEILPFITLFHTFIEGHIEWSVICHVVGH